MLWNRSLLRWPLHRHQQPQRHVLPRLRFLLLQNGKEEMQRGCRQGPQQPRGAPLCSFGPRPGCICSPPLVDSIRTCVASPIVLRVRTNLDCSLSSDQVGTLRTGAAFAFHEVCGGWPKLSPLHDTDLQTSISCIISDFKPHDPEAHGYCFSGVDGQESFEETSYEENPAVLARLSVTRSGSK